MDNKVQCKECGNWYKRVSTTHLKKHNMTYDDYFTKYPGVKIEHPDITNLRKQTLNNMIRRYGVNEGERRWKAYCDKQAETNTFEYKNRVHGMTKEEFDEYNTNRGQQGSANGNYGKGYYWHWVNTYGEDIANKMNAECAKYKDSRSLSFFVKKYGELEGLKKYDSFCLEQSERALELILKNNGRVIYNPKSIPIIEQYALDNGYMFKHAENGGEERILNYYVDGYDEDNKTIIEYYERGHRSTKKKDAHRIRRILKSKGSGWKVIVYWYDGKIEIYEN